MSANSVFQSLVHEMAEHTSNSVVHPQQDSRNSRSSSLASDFRVHSLKNIIGNMGQDLDYGFEEETSDECRDIMVGETSAFDMTFDNEELAVEDSEGTQEVYAL
ncbi:hypothetical protein PHLCEN_2v2101 [Hermanssonia centrifuga]|uniref:Uncharacterized protein n=1 Tax=Hermanssonia centrifuga TaxID=98765 RepID=A0A2R6RQ70_9APHY|nr:hypothetical protein PHLCEN_2v2101 [Hermanssonia centrifuga]